MNHIKQLINIEENPFILFDKWFAEAKEKEEIKRKNGEIGIITYLIKISFNF